MNLPARALCERATATVNHPEDPHRGFQPAKIRTFLTQHLLSNDTALSAKESLPNADHDAGEGNWEDGSGDLAGARRPPAHDAAPRSESRKSLVRQGTPIEDSTRHRAEAGSGNTVKGGVDREGPLPVPETKLPAPTPGSYPPGAQCWVELRTANPSRAKTFYGELCGWHLDDLPVSDGDPGKIADRPGYSVAVKNDVAVPESPPSDPAPVCSPRVGQPISLSTTSTRRSVGSANSAAP